MKEGADIEMEEGTDIDMEEKAGIDMDMEKGADTLWRRELKKSRRLKDTCKEITCNINGLTGVPHMG